MNPLEEIYSKLSEGNVRWLASVSPTKVAQIFDAAIAIARIGQTTSTVSSETSFDIGVTGEEYIINMLKKYLHDRIVCKISNVTQTAKSGDIIIETAQSKVLVEVKNYKMGVPYPEVEKFIRDLNRTNVDGGIFVSLKSPIAKISQSYLLRYENVNSKLKPVIYISANSEDVITAAIETILVLIERANSSTVSLQKLEQIRTNFLELESRVVAFSKLPIDSSEIHLKINAYLRNEFDMLVQAKCQVSGAVSQLRTLIFDNENTPTYTTKINIEEWSDKYDASTQDIIRKVIGLIEGEQPAEATNESQWKCLKTQITHLHKKTTIIFNKRPIISIQRVNDDKFLQDLFQQPRFQTVIFPLTTISSDSISLEITQDTIEFINYLLMAKSPA